MLKLAVLIVLGGLVGCAHVPQNYSSLRAKLLAMEQADQILRAAAQLDAQAITSSDNDHTSRMKEIVKTYGWPNISMVGSDGASAAWLLVQHADNDRPFQLLALSLMEPLVQTGKVKPSDYAYLWDRTHTPQRYGTQGNCISASQWEPRQIEDPEKVDARRSQIGLGMMSEYVTKISAHCT